MKKNAYIAITTILVIFTITGAFMSIHKGPYDTHISTDPTAWDKELSQVIYQLPESDRTLLKNYLDNHNPALPHSYKVEDVPLELSVGKAIQLQKEYLLSPQALRDKATENKRKSYDEIQNRLNDSLFVTYLSKEQTNDDNLIAITYAIKNKTTQNIVGFQGTAIYHDKNGSILQSIDVEKSLTILANDTITITEKYKKDDLNNFDLLKNLDSHAIDCKFTILSISFLNGKQLTLPQSNKN
jgi:hypothetical protein